jgi:hypothetical protein
MQQVHLFFFCFCAQWNICLALPRARSANNRDEGRFSFSDQKIILRNTKQDGTGDSSVGILPVSRKRKTSEFCSEPFLRRKKLLEFCSEPFRMRKTLEICSKPFLEEKKLQNSVPNQFSKQKTLEKRRLLLAAL